MTKKKSPHSVFIKRTGQMIRNQAVRARSLGRFLDYDLLALRTEVRKALDRRLCCYCRRELTASNFGADHMDPVSRGGSFNLDNLAFPCMDCNAAKGSMDKEEYLSLLNLMAHWHPNVRANVLARLKAGARIAKATKIKETTT
jgi:5-methylcytosine-specific restriction endonuclease McrA